MGRAVPLLLSVLVAVASAVLTLRSDGLYCDRLPSVTVVATLSAFLMALCFRLLAKDRSIVLFAALAVAAVCLFTDARFVIHYRGMCHELQQQFHGAIGPGQLRETGPRAV